MSAWCRGRQECLPHRRDDDDELRERIPMVGRKKDPKHYGLMAMYADAEALIEASRRTHDAGYRHIDAYTPFPVHGLSDAIGFRKTKLPAIVLCGGLTGAFCGFAMQYIANVWHYPINIGGKPLNSW